MFKKIRSAFGAVYDELTRQDFARWFQFSKTPANFNEDEIISVYTHSGLFQKVVDLVPDAASKFVLLDESNSEDADITTFFKYLKSSNIIDAFTEASKSARLFKEAYIILNLPGMTDTQYEMTELNELSTHNFEYLLCDTSQVKFKVDNFQNRTVYKLQTRDIQEVDIDPSRVLLFVGKYVPPKIRSAYNGYHISVVDGVLPSYGLLKHSINLSLHALSRMSTFIVKLLGLQKLIGEDKLAESITERTPKLKMNTREYDIRQRLRLLKQGLGTMGGILLDAENESAEWLNLNVTGVPDLIRLYEKQFTAETDISHDLLWNEGSNQTASDLENTNWEAKVNEFLAKHWEKKINYLYKILAPQLGIPYKPCVLHYQKYRPVEKNKPENNNANNTNTEIEKDDIK